MKILALDVGTSSVKASVMDVATAQAIGQISKSSYALDHPTAEAAEVSSSRLWQAIIQAAHEAIQEQDGIEGVGLSCLTPGLILLDKADQPVGPIWTHLDRRARPAALKVWAEVGPEFLSTAGNRPLPGGISALSWRQQLSQDPTLARRVSRYLHVNSWLGLHMTGETAFDPANACFSGLFGTMTDQEWSPRWCDYFRVDPDWLPRVVCGTTTLGALRPAIARELGVAPGLPVKLGTADTSSAMLAAAMTAGDLLHVVGTTQVLAAFTENPSPAPERLTRMFGVGKAFIQVTHNPVGGAALDWIRELCFQDVHEMEFFAQIIPQAMQRPPAVILDPPFLGGDRLEIEARRAAFRELTLATDRLDLLAAILRAMKERHEEALRHLGMGNQFRRIFLTGGGAQWIHQLIPLYHQVPVHYLEEGSVRGVARLFGQGDTTRELDIEGTM